jgi:BirA family biotin operon repressor/biotin-[acetyl-CoA-carboxylase] ligase
MRATASAANDGLVILAEEQLAGRGRLGRMWISPPRSSILMSALLFPAPRVAGMVPEAAFGCPWLTAVGAVATAEVVARWTGRQATIKWPNDVRVGGRKIAGILVERTLAPRESDSQQRSTAVASSGQGVVIGIGLNANVKLDELPDDLRSSATSLQIERGGKPVDRSDLCRDLIQRLDHWYELSRRAGPRSLNIPWRALSEHPGQIVQVATPGGSVIGRLIEMDLIFGLALEVEANRNQAPDASPDVRRVIIPQADVLALEA